MKQLANLLETIAQASPYWAELRFHQRSSNSLSVQKGMVKQAKSSLTSGVGIRVLVDGAWGFSSTSETTRPAIEKALKQAIECGKSLSQLKKAKIKKLPDIKLARGVYKLEGYDSLHKMSLKEKLESVLKAEIQTRQISPQIESANCTYNELFEDKIVVTSDGANATSQLVRNEIKLQAVASKEGERASGFLTSGATGAWECLFENNHSIESLAEGAAKLAIDLTNAPKVHGGPSTLILSPAVVGLLSHEAIGHTVEADFVLAGSVASKHLNQKVASSLVTLIDSGVVNLHPHGGGDLLVDDEGVLTQVTKIIDQGVLKSYLHSRESAAHFDVAPTGNARAWLYQDQPLIRMRNTYILPGDSSLEEMISSTQDGYLVDGPLGGQADSTGEFMFGAQKVHKIENGKLTKMYRGATISGQAFNVLSTVDAVSKEFKLDLGSGYCGKGQPAKVDAGGPWIRCKAIIGGVQ